MRKLLQSVLADDERGSALLVTLMVMVGVSLLGLGFVAVSETESAISVNGRNHAQVLAVAEAGSRVAVEWFEDPVNADSIGILPPNVTELKTPRTTPSMPTNWYKPTGLLFDKPFRSSNSDRFFGIEANPDFLVNDTTVAGTTFLTTFNNTIFGTAEDSGCTRSDGTAVRCMRVSDIRVFAPPILGGTLVPDGTGKSFWDGGTRYGYATIRVTSEKRSGSQIIATQTVKATISEWPFPGPQGPSSDLANIDTGGNFGVHWGKMTSMGTMADSRPKNCIPWFDATDKIHFEHGFDSSHLYQNSFDYGASGLNFKYVHSANALYSKVAYSCSPCAISQPAATGEPPFTGTVGETVTETHPAWAASTAYTAGIIVSPTASTGFSYLCVAAGTSAAAEPVWPTTAGLTKTDGSVTWRTIPTMIWHGVNATAYPNDPSALYEANDWLYELPGKLFDDLWFEARARDDMLIPSGVGLTPLHIRKYNDPTFDENNSSEYWSLYQGQDTTTPLDKKEVTFPRIDYDFWKEIAVQGSGTNHVYYLRWVSGEDFTDGVSTKSFASWLNSDPGIVNPAEAGFYFFDSKNGVNPQVTGGATSPYLTDTIVLNSSDANPWQAKGFIYVNAATIDFAGINGVKDYYNYPGEPYRDVGFRRIDETTGAYLIGATGDYVIDGRFDGVWTPQDVNHNGIFDYKLAPKTVTRNDAGTVNTYTGNFIVPYSPECGIAGIANLKTGFAGNCSEPAEPYLNIQYPPPGTSVPVAGDPAPGVRISWGGDAGAPAGYSVNQPKHKLGSGALPTCTGAVTETNCTSAGYDADGGMIYLDPIVIGILYNEGTFEATGNPRFYGSLLINGDVGKAGTAQAYFDESLLKGTWQDQFDFPRVFISSQSTDK
jgi:hypothetical protein